MIRITGTTTDRRKKEIEKFLKSASKINGAYVSVGFHEGAGQYEDGQDVIEVALWNEFGTRNIPERSFIRSAITDSHTEINKWRLEAMDKVMTQGWSIERALEMLGFRIQVLIQNKIKSNVPPPNAPSTVAQKQSDGVAPNTLIHTGLMLRSVGYKVVVK